MNRPVACRASASFWNSKAALATNLSLLKTRTAAPTTLICESKPNTASPVARNRAPNWRLLKYRWSRISA